MATLQLLYDRVPLISRHRNRLFFGWLLLALLTTTPVRLWAQQGSTRTDSRVGDGRVPSSVLVVESNRDDWRAPLPPLTGTVPLSPSRSARAAAPTIRYVKAGASGNGTSWSNASGDLQAMIDASASGDQVWIVGGTYKPRPADRVNVRESGFSLKDGVGVLGGFIGQPGTEGNVTTRTASPSSTTLSGDIGRVGDRSDNCYHVIFNNQSGLSTATVLDGVVVTGGNSNGSSYFDERGGGIFLNGENVQFVNCLLADNSATVAGGGIYAQGARGMSLTNCQFVDNSSQRGGGMCLAELSTPQVSNCLFRENTATYAGGGMYVQSATGLRLTDCRFLNNSATGSESFGGGLFVTDGLFVGSGSNQQVSNCLFRENTATYAGGGMYVQGATGLRLTDCQFVNNSGTSRGGGLGLQEGSNQQVSNCSFRQNTVSDFGGGVYASKATGLSLTDCQFVDNSAMSRGGGLGLLEGSNQQVINCSFRQNTATNSGGGMFVELARGVGIRGCQFVSNSATASGSVGGGCA